MSYLLMFNKLIIILHIFKDFTIYKIYSHFRDEEIKVHRTGEIISPIC